MAHVHQWEDYLDLNYFICTLGLAAAVNKDHPQPFKTVNDFIDHQAQEFPSRPAVGFPIPQRNEGEQWGQTVYSKSPCVLLVLCTVSFLEAETWLVTACFLA